MLPWSLVLPIVVNVGLIAWLFGGLSQRIRILETEMDQMRTVNRTIDDRVHAMALVLARVEIKIEGLLNPPILAQPIKRSRRKKGNDEEVSA